MKPRALPVFLAFFVMGFVDSVGALVGYAREQFHLSGAMAGLLPFFGFLAFAIVSVPAGILAERRGKKLVLALGLGLVVLGELVPFASIDRYAYLLAAIFLIGVGMAVLQVAGNPIMRDVSAPGKYAQYLTFAQFVKSLGSNLAPYLLPFVVTLGWGWTGVFPVFAAFAALSLLFVVGLKVPESSRGGSPAGLGTSLSLLRDSRVAALVLGIFLYVGAEVGLNSWVATHLNRSFGMELVDATRSLGLFLGGLAIGRLAGTALLSFVSVHRLFLAMTVVGFVSVAGVMSPWKIVVLASVLVAGLAFSNVWPLAFAIAVEERPDRSGELSGLMCMAIFGGALLPLLMGQVADAVSVRAAFAVPLLCFAYLVLLALGSQKRGVHAGA